MTTRSAAAARVAGVRLTHPDREMFPGLSKTDLARYFEAAAPHMLPHIAGRPASLVRCPDGQGGECFFQKHAGTAVGPEIGQVEIPEKKGADRRYLTVETKAGLVACAQVAAIELHVWAARRDRLDRPDRMVFDLDPDESLQFADVARAALDLRQVLDSAGLQTFAMLTGGKGVHIVLPLERRLGWGGFAGFARDFAEKMAALDSRRFVAGMSKARRAGRIFIDHLRNGRGATAIAPFSPRARKGAPVAVPVAWDDLDAIDTAAAFTLYDTDAVLAQAKAWTGYTALRQRLTRDCAGRLGLPWTGA